LSSFAPFIGVIAALLASLSYLPQVRKAWPRGSTGDLSLGMLSALTLGLGLWVVYGAIEGDWSSCWPMSPARRCPASSWAAKCAICWPRADPPQEVGPQELLLTFSDF
jgi:hypothetical protein